MFTRSLIDSIFCARLLNSHVRRNETEFEREYIRILREKHTPIPSEWLMAECVDVLYDIRRAIVSRRIVKLRASFERSHAIENVEKERLCLFP